MSNRKFKVVEDSYFSVLEEFLMEYYTVYEVNSDGTEYKLFQCPELEGAYEFILRQLYIECGVGL